MGGYKKLLIYRTSVTIFDFNIIFCERFLSHPKHRRVVEQMYHAARSGKQNIAEGSKELSTSSDMILNSVSRSSYTELVEDYEDFLRSHNLPIWDKNDPRVLTIRAFREVIDNSTVLTDLTNWTNLDFGNPENFTNLMLCLCHKQGYLMDQFLREKEKRFVEKGGFRENLLKKRLEYRKKNAK